MKSVKFLAVALMMLGTMTVSAQKFGKTPEDSLACIENQYLLQESYKNKQYLDAYEPLKEVLKHCPAYHKNNYVRGVTIIKAKFNATKIAEERAALTQELMNLYNLRIQYFGEAAEVTAMKAYDCEQLRGTAGLEEYYGYYAKAMELGAESIKPALIERYFDATIRYVLRGFADTTLIIDNYDVATDALDKIAAKAKDSTALVEVNQVISNVEAKFSPFASCEELLNIYSKKFAETPDDVNLLKKITTILRKKGCTKTDLFFSATERLHSIEPTAQTAYLMAQMCYNKDRFSEAVKYLEEAIKGMDEATDRYKAYMLMGMSHASNNSYSAARSAYLRAAEVQPNKGEPYRMIAQLYAQGHRSVEDGMGGRSAYWAAVDKANRAKAVDPSEENVAAANRLISAYSSAYPKQSEAFMLDLIDGNSFRVPGWIGETTTVRTRK